VAYDEAFAQRVREVVPELPKRKMFGGLAWMVNGNMAVAVMGIGGLLVRIDPDEAEEAFAQPGVGPFGREGAKPMTGFARVEESAVEDPADLTSWIDRGVTRAATLPPK
jgi:TfoX/Sxy family transcriptional regulator of competence genes